MLDRPAVSRDDHLDVVIVLEGIRAVRHRPVGEAKWPTEATRERPWLHEVGGVLHEEVGNAGQLRGQLDAGIVSEGHGSMLVRGWDTRPQPRPVVARRSIFLQ